VLTGFNHVAILTDDLDRLEDFYRDVFEVTDVHDMQFEDVHHRLLRVGDRSVLHAFEKPAPAPAPIFQRGRVDHVALNVDDHEAFEQLRARLVEVGASDGTITDFGALLSVSFEDPDGLACELCWFRPGAKLVDAVDPW
jgi:catechol 2,3-dioxygenase-like lactoylglutathione lyase family enzyme